MKTAGRARGVAVVVRFALGCSDATTGPQILAKRSKPIYIEIAGTWVSEDQGTTVVISDLTNPDNVAGDGTLGGEVPFVLYAVRDGGDRRNVTWAGPADFGSVPMNVVLTLTKGNYKPGTRMIMEVSFHGYLIARIPLARVK